MSMHLCRWWRGASLLLAFGASLGLGAAPARAELSARQMEDVAGKLVHALGGPAGTTRTQATPSGLGVWSGGFVIHIDRQAGGIISCRDSAAAAALQREMAASYHQPLPPPPAERDVVAAAVRLIAGLFGTQPDAARARVVATPMGTWARVRWEQRVPETGFPTGGGTEVLFNLRSGRVAELQHWLGPIPDEWRRPPSITEEEARAAYRERVELPADAVTDLYVTREAHNRGLRVPFQEIQPVWAVTAVRRTDGPGPHGPGFEPTLTTLYLDPWTGDTIRELRAGGGGVGPSHRPARGSVWRVPVWCVVPLAVAATVGVTLSLRRRARGRATRISP